MTQAAKAKAAARKAAKTKEKLEQQRRLKQEEAARRREEKAQARVRVVSSSYCDEGRAYMEFRVSWQVTMLRQVWQDARKARQQQLQQVGAVFHVSVYAWMSISSAPAFDVLRNV